MVVGGVFLVMGSLGGVLLSKGSSSKSSSRAVVGDSAR